MRRPTCALTAPGVINGDPTVRRSTTATENARNADTHTKTTDATGNRNHPARLERHRSARKSPPFPCPGDRLCVSLSYEDRIRLNQVTKKARLSLVSTLAFHYLCLANPRGQSRKCKRPTDKNRSKTQKKQSDQHIEP